MKVIYNKVTDNWYNEGDEICGPNNAQTLNT